MAASHDLVIRNATIVDGSGAPAFQGHIAVDGEMITTVAAHGGGDDPGRGHREIDADGRLVTPGFVDIHTHYDAQATWDPELTPSGWHGVTTVVMGNCGVGFAPVEPHRRDWLIGLMEGVEDIPGAAMHDGIRWEWETFEEYLDALDARRWVADVGTQVPHGALRAYVMGERGAANEAATPGDIATMAELTQRALRAGALGFSTSRTPLHKAADGEFVPGTFAAPEELLAIGGAISAAGHGVFQAALHHPDAPGAFEWMTELARRSGARVTFNLNQPDDAPDLWRTDLDLIERAVASGADVRAQVAGRPVGILMAWDATANPFALRPSWGEVASLAPVDRRAKLADPTYRRRLIDETPVDLGEFLAFITSSWSKMWIVTDGFDYEPDPSGTVAAIAEEQRRPPAEVAYDALCADDGRGQLWFPLFNYSQENLDVLHDLHRHDLTIMGLADAGAHCATICDGSMPTFMMSFWARDRRRGPTLPLERVVHRQTRATALHYGLADRGLLAAGMRADLNVIDADRIAIGPAELVYDLPTGAPRYLQGAQGYGATVCRGEVVAEADQATGATPGRLVRGPQSP
ncbi:MAG: amidohydrolase family protein [Acidimicrobiales bacterium]